MIQTLEHYVPVAVYPVAHVKLHVVPELTFNVQFREAN